MAKKNSLKKQTVVSILGIALTIACASVAVLWETIGRDTYLYKEVLVAAKEIKKGDIISSDVLQWSKTEENKIITNAVKNENEIIGKAAKNYIPKNAQLSSEYFDDANIVLKSDQFIFKVPSDWVIAIPSSIRRQDEVIVCEINKEYFTTQSQNTSGDNNETKAATSSNYISLRTKPDDWLKNFDVDNLTTLTDGNIRPPIFAATVAYVKDSNNREVITVGTNDRYDGSSQINSIEIIITLKELRAMELSLEKGNKLLILNKEH